MGARIGAVHDGLVGPFESERLDQRLANARIPEFVAADIYKPPLRARRRVIGQGFALDPAILHGGEIIARGPDPRGEFLTEQVVLRSEALERDIAVAVE